MLACSCYRLINLNQIDDLRAMRPQNEGDTRNHASTMSQQELIDRVLFQPALGLLLCFRRSLPAQWAIHSQLPRSDLLRNGKTQVTCLLNKTGEVEGIMSDYRGDRGRSSKSDGGCCRRSVLTSQAVILGALTAFTRSIYNVKFVLMQTELLNGSNNL